MLVGHSLEDQPAVAKIQPLFRRTRVPKPELRYGQIHHQRIDFVVMQSVARAGKRRGDAGPQPNYADANRSAIAQCAKRPIDAGAAAEIRRRDPIAAGDLQFAAVTDRAVNQQALRRNALPLRNVTYAQHSVKIPRRKNVEARFHYLVANQVTREGDG